MSTTDNYAEGAIRWLDEIRGRTSTVEPDWWLRMECGQLLDAPEAVSNQESSISSEIDGGAIDL